VPATSAYLYWLIIGCEAAFWVVLAMALAARYLLTQERVSRALLFSLPGIDLLLLLFTAADLQSGTPATFAHGLATVYIGFTIAFGGVLVKWADAKFAHRFAGGPQPAAAPSLGWPAVRYEFSLWIRSIVAWIIALVCLGGLIAFVGDTSNTAELKGWYQTAAGAILLWFIFGPLWRLVFFKRATTG
jgi:hypothetical protein